MSIDSFYPNDSQEIIRSNFSNNNEIDRRIDIDKHNETKNESEENDTFDKIVDERVIIGDDVDDLTDSQRSRLLENGMSQGSVDKISVRNDDTYELRTQNSKYEGVTHPETGVPYERKTVDNGDKIQGVFPVFDSKFDAYLPAEKLKASDNSQFNECNKQLKQEIENNPELEKAFSKRQLEQIKAGDTPSGFVWHHNEEEGKMQLVDFDTHFKTNHTGGKAIWGGGKDNR